MMSIAQISATAAALGNQMAAGIPIEQIVQRMPVLQPTLTDFWMKALQIVRNGSPLSTSMKDVWPESLVHAMEAGEASGKLDEILLKIEKTMEVQEQLKSKAMGLMYPVGLGLGGILVFLGFMIFVLPALFKAIDTGKSMATQTMTYRMSMALHDFFFTNWPFVAGALAIGIVAFAAWIKKPEAKQFIFNIVLGMPVLKDAARDLYFGMWAHYMALMSSAGIPTIRGLKLTKTFLPPTLEEPISLMVLDLERQNKTMSDSIDVKDPDDARAIWVPFYISNAFVVAEQTGEIDKEMDRVAPILVREGTKKVDRFLSIANLIMLAVSGLLIMTPIGSYYNELFGSIKRIM